MSRPVCRLLPFSVNDGPGNMAADEVLLEMAATTGLASLRFYGWSEATLSLGYFQPANVRLSDPLLAPLPYVRRPSGGAALVHHREVTYALALPAGSPWQQRGESWIQRMHGIIRDALEALQIPLHVCCAGEEKKRGDVLCFLQQTPCDLLFGAHKVVGSAQRKQRGALLQHGAILLVQSAHTPALPGLQQLAGINPDDAFRVQLLKNLCLAVAANTGWLLGSCDSTSNESRRREELIREKYTAQCWNNKR